jgi:aminoglycoside phosphotransferase (APT) family kinase protein
LNQENKEIVNVRIQIEGEVALPELDDFGGLVNWDGLQQWVLDQDEAIPGQGPVREAIALQGGAQNVVLRLGREGGEFILRRPPRHLRPNSNKTMSREGTILAALRDTQVPHPTFYAACEDPTVIGANFYAMQMVDGFTPLGTLPERYDATWRRGMAFELIDAAARLGSMDPSAVGLENFGHTEDWAERQVERWRSQLEGYSELGYNSPIAIQSTSDWLAAHVPSATRMGIIHGDLQWANTIFSDREPKLLAIIDWELSTLGDPLLDLGWILTSWVEDDDPPGHVAQLNPTEGLPSRDEIIERYAEVSGRDVTEMPWYFVLACYKLGILLEGTWARAQAGKASMEIGLQLHSYAEWLFSKAEQLIGESGDR